MRKGRIHDKNRKCSALAKSMVRVSKSLGIETIAQITSMDEPIGNMIGNAHEVVESLIV